MTWYLKGQSNYNNATGFHMGFYMDMNGFASGLYDSRYMPAHVEKGDPFMAFAVKTKNWIPASQQVEWGLWDHFRVRVDASGVWGWHEVSGAWFSLFGGGDVGASQLSNLTDVGSISYTSGFVLKANGSNFNAGYLNWGDVANKPSEFTPTSHNNTYHSETYVTAAEAISAVEGEATLVLGGILHVSGTTKTAGNFYAGSSTPTNTDRLNYDGYLYATKLYVSSTEVTPHARSHAMTGTSDHTSGNWKVFYSNGSGEVIELALGDDGDVLTSTGTGTAPAFETPSVGGTTIEMDATPASNGDYSGSVMLIDTTSCSNYQVVYVDGADSVLPADANGSGTYPVIGMVVATGYVLTHGVVRNDSWTLTAGSVYYLSTTAGSITTTPPSTAGDYVQIIGVAVGTDQLFVNPQLFMVKRG